MLESSCFIEFGCSPLELYKFKRFSNSSHGVNCINLAFCFSHKKFFMSDLDLSDKTDILCHRRKSKSKHSMGVD